MTPIEHDDEVWVVLADDKVDFEDSDDFEEDKDDLR
jgi:hypothetical protein